ncbi:hypothetical protein Goshw_005847 [Gossypium schwendimanii]|uniref:DUF7745 domain-containing protein n=1 Tax=Gossypium schwendimanii TaxID=34291 RepID=A0A7J9MFV3_GOSSC|nr:hypothetical protein [Gossypium schwendimanii]
MSALLVRVSLGIFLHIAWHNCSILPFLSGSKKLFLRELFYRDYGDLPYLLEVKVDKHLFRALVLYWILPIAALLDLVPTVEEAANVLTFLKRLMSITGMNLILAHPNTKKRVKIFALSIYGLVIFPKALGYIDDVASDLFDQLDKTVTPIPAILDETFRSLSAYRKAGEGRYIGCVQLLLAWFHSHFWKVEKFISAMQGLAQCDFTYKGDNYKKKWWSKRVNDNVPVSSQENTRPIKEHFQVIISELEIVKQDFEKRTSELGKKIEKLEEENIQLGLDIDIQKARVSELERSLHQYRSCNFAIELKASLNKIEELKGKIEELEATLQNCELQVKLFETNNKHWKEQLQCSHGQIRDRDHIMGEAVTQASTLAPVNYPTGLGSNLRDNPTNPVIPDLDDMVEMDKARVELPKQLKDRCKWLEEKFRAMEYVDYLCGVDAKELSLVLDLVLQPKLKTPEFEKYNETSYPEAYITMLCRRMTGYINNNQLIIHYF